MIELAVQVRMHMANKHQDSTSNPIDNYCEELQKTWDLLMEKCFPSYADKISASNVSEALPTSL